MVCIRCKMVVKSELDKLGLHYTRVELGEIEILEDISTEQIDCLKVALKTTGLELMEDKKRILAEKIKTTIIELIHYTDYQNKIKLSDYLSEKLDHPYPCLTKLFLEVKGTSIEKYYLAQKIERVKELLGYDGLTISDIAFKLHYSSEAHLSKQFKKKTGLTPSHFKNFKNCGKASGFDHSWPDQIDHQESKLSACYLAMYVICNLTGHMWSISPAFATGSKILNLYSSGVSLKGVNNVIIFLDCIGSTRIIRLNFGCTKFNHN